MDLLWKDYAEEKPVHEDHILVCGDHHHTVYGKYDGTRNVVVVARYNEFAFMSYKSIHWLKPDLPKKAEKKLVV
jgi:hypothetical protein